MSPGLELAQAAARADWPRVLGPPEVHAVLRADPEDFEVEEVPRVEPGGEGSHLWLWIEKRGANTPWVADQLARAAGCRGRDVGYAGMKDRHALTRQWFSVPLPAAGEPAWRDWRIDGVRVLDARRHARKLQRGALDGNRFRIVLRELRGATGSLADRLQQLAAGGLPNYFGEQRFGHGGMNVHRGALGLLGSARLDRKKRGIYLSAVRSAVFNEVLAARVRGGSWNRILPGEIAMLDGTHSVFACESVDAELERRCREFDIHPTGPLPGRGGLTPSSDAGAVERVALEPHATLAAALAAAGMDAGRRSLRLKPVGLEWRIEEDALTLRFGLPPGAYATVLVRELVSAESRRHIGEQAANRGTRETDHE